MGWSGFADRYHVEAPGPYCLDYCAPELPFLAGTIGISSFGLGLLVLAYSWLEPKSQDHANDQNSKSHTSGTAKLKSMILSAIIVIIVGVMGFLAILIFVAFLTAFAPPEVPRQLNDFLVWFLVVLGILVALIFSVVLIAFWPRLRPKNLPMRRSEAAMPPNDREL